jgi:putative PEP-CTERM system histidine kinase
VTGLLILWSHALAALLLAVLGATAMRGARPGLPATRLGLALFATALWALAVAGVGGGELVTRVLDMGRNLAWLAVVHGIRRQYRPIAIAERVSYALVAAVFAMGGLLSAVAAAIGGPSEALMNESGGMLRIAATLGALILAQPAYAASRHNAARIAAMVAAALWLVDVNLLTLAWATGAWPGEIVATRGAVLVAAAAVLAAVMLRDGDRRVQLSRTVAYQSLSLLAIVGYFAVLALVTGLLERVGGGQARILQTAFVFGSTASALAVLSSPRLRAWSKVKLAKHLFRHRYDYRTEWMRFTETLGRPGDAGPLEERVVKAVADLTLSPAGLLMVPDEDGLGLGAGWNWAGAELPMSAQARALAAHLAATGRIVELDAVRDGSADTGDRDSVPQWMIDEPAAWAIVPLPHLARLEGAILLARPPIDRALDWEDFDLLKVAGRQVASYLAEARAQARLTEAGRFEEFNRRFAFILHDIKNLVSQLSLVARNAERHADNPAFRADMVATLNDAAARMTDMVARLSQAKTPRGEAVRAVVVGEAAERVATAHRAGHPVVVTGDRDAVALADPAGLEQILRHLAQNAVEASDDDRPVTIAVACHRSEVWIDVIDEGCGMAPGFVRDRLFKPFDSTKAAGFGLGAFEARQLALAMGGVLEVASREGEGTRFRLILPMALPGEAKMENAA